MKMNKTIIVLMFGIILISLASAETIIAGNNYTFSIDTTDNLFWDVVGNSSNMEGFEIYQDIYDNYSNITFVTDYKFAPDNFTIILFLNKTKEIVKEVPVYRGGGGGSRTVYKDKNITIEKEVEKIIYVNQTEDTEEEPIEAEEEKKSLLLFYILCGIIILAIIFMWYRVVKKHKENKNEFKNTKQK